MLLTALYASLGDLAERRSTFPQFAQMVLHMMPDASRPALYVHIHLVSDSTGETLMNAMRAAVAQFDNVEAVEHLYALVRSPKQLDRVLEAITAEPGVVLFTLVDDQLRRRLEQRCAELNVPALAVLDPLVATLSRYIGAPPRLKIGAQHDLDAEYYKRIAALNYALAHDDGQNLSGLVEAEVVLVGVSRSSKTPTCMYLAHRGVRAANVPLVSGASPPPILDTLSGPLIVGLTASPDRLVQIRQNRLLALNEDRSTDYVDETAVRAEVIEAKRLFERKGWRSIDVTRRSIEETAAQIINLLKAHREGRSE